jgi:hypothetical protein
MGENRMRIDFIKRMSSGEDNEKGEQKIKTLRHQEVCWVSAWGNLGQGAV